MKILALSVGLISASLLSGYSPATELEKLQRMHSFNLKRHVYITDQEQYGVNDKWVSSLRGDCEDYAMYNMEQLGRGKMMIVQTESLEWHMVLVVDDKYVIDNLSKSVYSLSSMPHRRVTYVKAGVN